MKRGGIRVQALGFRVSFLASGTFCACAINSQPQPYPHLELYGLDPEPCTLNR